MDSSIGHCHVILFSLTLLFNGGVSKGRDGAHSESGGRKFGSYLLAGYPSVNPAIIAPGTTKSVRASKAHGEIRLDLSDIADDIGMPALATKISQIDQKIDTMQRDIVDSIREAQRVMQGFPNMEVQVQYLAQSMPTILATMQYMSEKIQAQQQVIQQSTNHVCDTRGFEQSVQVLRSELASLAAFVKQMKSDESSRTKIVYDIVTKNYQVLKELHQGMAQAANTCSACLSKPANPGPIVQNTDSAVLKLSSIVESMPQGLMDGFQKALRSYVIQQSELRTQENNNVIQYLTELASKMMDYRDDYLKRLMEQNKKMEVIRKTVTQTTQVLKQEASGAKNVSKALDASRSAIENCGRGKNNE